MGKRILLVWDRLGDYHRARAEALRTGQAKYEVLTADLGGADELYMWQSSNDPFHFQLSKNDVDESDFWRRTLRFLWLILFKRVRIVGLAGYGRFTYVFFILLAKLLGKKVIVFAESWYGKRNTKNYFKSIFLNLFVNGFFVSGKRAEEFFLKTLKLRRKRVKTGYSVVDNEHFKARNVIMRSLFEYPHILCVARFAREKNHERMIDAFLRSEAAKQYHLKLVGTGPMLSTLQKRFSQRKEIIFAPWTDYADLPNLYRQATAFVLPSTFEPWGLVVNEAMATGLPILLSKQVGCVPELSTRENSFVFDAYRTQEIRQAFDLFYALDHEQCSAMGNASFNLIKNLNTRTWAKTFLSLAKERDLMTKQE